MSVIIRDACISDAPRLLEIYSYYVQHTAISFEYTTPTQEEFCRRMRHIMSRYPYLVAEVDGTVQGYAYAGAFVGRAAYDWSCELTIYLACDARKMGLGAAAVYGAGTAVGADGGAEPLRLHRLAGGGGRVSHPQQRPVP